MAEVAGVVAAADEGPVEARKVEKEERKDGLIKDDLGGLLTSCGLPEGNDNSFCYVNVKKWVS